LKTCSTAIFFTNKDGKEKMIRIDEDSSGKIIAREVCGINPFGDVRLCADWDRGTTHRDMKDANRHWSKVADQ
jgi:hypothetical protein